MAKVTHLEVITVAPSESDPDSDGYVLCGREEGELHLTHHAKFVTCKNCIRALAQAKTAEKGEANG